MARAILKTVVGILMPVAATLSVACAITLGATACSVIHPLDGFTSPPDTTDAPNTPSTIPTTMPSSTATGSADSEPPVDAGLADASDATIEVDAGDEATTPTPTQQHFLYAIGGSFTEDLFQDNIYYAPILPDGSLGDWDVTTPLTTGIRNHAAVVHGDDVYVIGGEYAGGMLSADVHVSTFLPSGKLGPWKVFTGVLSDRRKDHAAALAGDSLYVGGGFDGQLPLKPILRATLSPSSLGAFTTVGSYADGMRIHAMASIGSTLFSIGGALTTGYLPDVLSFPIGSGGALGAGTKLAPLPVGLGYHRTVVIGSTVYLVGGVSGPGSTMTSTVYASTLQPNGTLTAWQRLKDFTTGRWRHAAVGAFGNVYMGGGRVGDIGPFLADVQIARVLPDKSLEWRTSPKSLPKPLASHALVAH